MKCGERRLSEHALPTLSVALRSSTLSTSRSMAVLMKGFESAGAASQVRGDIGGTVGASGNLIKYGNFAGSALGFLFGGSM